MEAMKSYRKELWFNIPSRRGFVNITPDVEACLRESKIKDGLVLCNAMHITDGLLSSRRNTNRTSAQPSLNWAKSTKSI